MIRELRNTLRHKAMMNKTSRDTGEGSIFGDFLCKNFEKQHRSQSREDTFKFKSRKNSNTAINS